MRHWRCGVPGWVVPPLVTSVLFLLLGSFPVSAQMDDEERERTEARDRWEVLPDDLLYPPYLADLGRPMFSLLYVGVESVGITDATDARNFVSLGARAGLVRWRPRSAGEIAFQLDLYAGFHGQFDREFSNDNIGWDGVYGLIGSMTLNRALAFQVGLAHLSSHVGDEYAERTGRRRINYTREELLVGGSWDFGSRWRFYGELASAYDLRNEALQEEGRWQVGLEYECCEGLWGTRLGWYAALDVEAMEERDWETDVSAQIGIRLPSASRTWRLGLAWYEGRAPIGEFFQAEEEYLAFGLWMDI